ncbi:replicative DNA helicase [Crocosphaera sp. UHCC 0190]|uniref:replicative DNA helicase n=1 Tax=Crocosphaera sp. UHCC 0190 TaxID=3110246 RepID=UPI002B20FD2A|nr:replicative DNA helicase [Crocosphaera sp. UHCC 0190]MEA5511810.1 replicative DNA helicase [Crocosphaera sp. UHCC 0190]
MTSLPPQNIEAEESILGGILVDPEAMGRIVDLITAEAFYVKGHQEIYQAALKLHRSSQPTDVMTVKSTLEDHHLLEQVGGIEKLMQLVDRTVSAVNIDRYALLVMEKYLRRQLIAAGHNIVELGFETTQELDDIFYQSEKRLFEVSQQRSRGKTQPNCEVAIEAYQTLETDSPIYPTGLNNLDNLIVGWEAGTLTLLAGRPSMGKSFCAMYLAVAMMVQYNRSVVFFSLEMTKKQLEYRLWSLLSVLPYYSQCNIIPISNDRFRRHRAGLERLETEEIATIAQIMGLAAEMPLYLNDDRSLTVSVMASECRRLISEKKPIGLIIVDYLQMMAADSELGNRSYELGDVARELYKLAGDLQVPVLALSQISRAVESRNDKRPMMSDLSQSGILEMVADNIILAYRDDYYNPDTPDPEVLELIVAKARHGTTGTAKVLFDRAYGLIKVGEEQW